MGEGTFRNATDGHPRSHLVASLGCGSKLPGLDLIQTIRIVSSFQEPARLFRQYRQRVLKSVIHLTQKARAQFCRQHVTGEFHFIPKLDPVGHFIDLDLRHVSADTDDFALQRNSVHIDITYFIQGNISVKFDGNHIPVYAYNLSCLSSHCTASNLSPCIIEL